MWSAAGDGEPAGTWEVTSGNFAPLGSSVPRTVTVTKTQILYISIVKRFGGI